MIEEKTKTEEIKEDTDDIKENAKDLVEHVTDFLETYYRYAGVTLAEKGVNIGSAVINSFIFIFLGLITVSFLGFGLAWWLGDVVSSRAGGFFIVAGIFLLVMVILTFMRKSLIFPFLRNLLTRKIYE